MQKKKGGQDRFVLDNQYSSVTLNELAMKARKSYCNFKLLQKSHTMTDINPNEVLFKVLKSSTRMGIIQSRM